MDEYGMARRRGEELVREAEQARLAGAVPRPARSARPGGAVARAVRRVLRAPAGRSTRPAPGHRSAPAR